MSSQKYQKVETNSSDSQEELSQEEQKDMAAHVSNIPSTHSSQQLMNADAESVLTEEDAKSISRRNRQAEASSGFASVSAKEWFTVGVLCFINLINYMDRFTIAGESPFSLPPRNVLLLCANEMHRLITNTFK